MGIMDKIGGLFAPAPKVCAVPASERPSRNQPCWCGSGKKYKKCHMEADEAARPKPKLSCGST